MALPDCEIKPFDIVKEPIRYSYDLLLALLASAIDSGWPNPMCEELQSFRISQVRRGPRNTTKFDSL